MPALLTSTSMGPPASSAAAMLSGLVTSSAQHAQPLRARQDVLARRSHGGDHVPALRVEVARGLEAVARRAAGDEYGLHGGSSRWFDGADNHSSAVTGLIYN